MKRTKKTRQDQKGFTLIELMIALVIISLMICGYVQANIMAQRNTEEMNERTIAIQDANRVIEQIRDVANTPMSDFPSDTVTAFPNGNPVAGINNLPNEAITVSYTGENPTTANPLYVTITVAWMSYNGRSVSETVETYITQRGGPS